MGTPSGRSTVSRTSSDRGRTSGRPAREPAIQPVALERSSTPDMLARALRGQILSGSLAAGTRLREVEVAEAFGVSRQTLRAALAQLVHEGLLARAPHRGVWVPALDAADLRDVFELRAVLEAEAASRIASEPARADAVRPVLERLGGLRPDAAWAETLEAHLAFHRALVDAAGSPRLSRAYALLWSEASLGLVAARHHPLSAQGGQLEAHRSLLAAIVAGPPESAGRLARDHLVIGLGTALAALDGEP